VRQEVDDLDSISISPAKSAVESGRAWFESLDENAFLPNGGVLVVDDEPGIVRLLEFALRQRGHEVWVASDGVEAVEVFERHRAQIALVLMDVVLPGMNGPQSLEAMRLIEPRVACCFMTGNSGDYTAEDLGQFAPLRIFLKPFVLSEILEMAGQVAAARS
jgi:CheY-like chemotaxis protein